MNLEQIEKLLNLKFKNIETIWQKRKIIFWYDSNWEFKEDIDNLNLDNVKVHKLDKNYFETKYILEKKDTNSNYLVYSNSARPDDKNNWLLDIELYSDNFSADRASMIMNELKIENNSLKTTIQERIKFFWNKERKESFKSLIKSINNLDEKYIKVCIMLVVCWIKNVENDSLIRKVLIESLDEEENKYIKEFQKYWVLDFFWEIVEKRFWYSPTKKSLIDFFKSLMLTYIKSTSNLDLSKKYSHYINLTSNNTKIFLNSWMTNIEDREKYREYARELENQLKFHEIINNYEIKDYYDCDNLELFDKSILLKISDELSKWSKDYKYFYDLIDKRRTKHWYDMYQNQYNTITYAVNILNFKDEYEDSFKYLNCKQLLSEYTKTFYLIDLFYRKFYYYHDLSQKKLKSNILAHLRELIENVYTNWFLEKLWDNWDKLLNDELNKKRKIETVVSQQNFYDNFVKWLLEKTRAEKVFVVISDALRYEVANEVNQKLQKEKWDSKIDCMLWVVPSFTKLWMACLLPHESIEITADWWVFVDWVSSSWIENRNKILQKNKENSVAYKWTDLEGISQLEWREKFKWKEIIYIYHDIIDSTWDKPSSEKDVFDACEKTVDELEEIVKRITTSWNWTHVLITADHWFIYKRDKIKEYDRVQVEKEEKIDWNRKFFITKNNKNIDWLKTISLWYLDWNSDYYVKTPYWNSVLKLQWWGSNFVHWWTSLQEITIPVIHFNRKESEKVSKQEVSIQLISKSRRITTNTFTLDFFQTKPVEGKLLEWKYKVSLWDLNENWKEKQISDEQIILANRTSKKEEDRVFRISLNLKSWNYDGNKNYHLRIIPDNTINNEELERIPFKIEVLIQNDFDSFF